MRVRFGRSEMEYPSEQLAPLRASDGIKGDMKAMRRTLTEDGYLYLPGFFDREAVLRARSVILEYMDRHQALTPGTPVLEGVMPPGGKGVSMMGRREITHHQDVISIFESPELFGFFEKLFGGPALTYDYKWLRAVGIEQFTGCHYDVVYMGRGSRNVHTAWIPFGDIPVEQGTLAMCRGSHSLESFARLRETYGAMDVDRDHVEGWFSEDPAEIGTKYGGTWETSDFRAGDLMVFGLYLMHASTTNTTNRFRLSCDIRFQPAGEPVDERWIGDKPRGHFAWTETPVKPIAEARKEWGV